MLSNKSLRIKNHIINNMQDPVKADVDYPVGYGFVDVNPDCDEEEELLPWTN